ncbi:PREDICTED: uncharacterized protein LOC108562258 [Nicrophorus vespilloides]|uniref:Uncharacterized protein LOC108562258 n=1 Tax=Nicrophorus vespilloides TaxID=110193 RepID=A0ABM1MN73_NICVS|nr:PREDICTED: uncharacterized protein LOC108562258 [Nicrophorus vespilloides]
MAKRFNRRILYKLIESKIKFHGFPGLECLLRVICEASTYTFQHTGVLADLFHIIFTPSSSKENFISREYHQAEHSGKMRNCSKYNDKCSISLLDLFSYIGDIL